jgi:DNA segregation ATPase FtsK/SpoIIIE, S-DNA-T family
VMLPNAQQKASLSPEQLDNVSKIVSKFIDLGVDVEFQPPVMTGPVISLYKFKPTGKTRVSHIEALAADFAALLGHERILVQRRTGDTAVSIAVPNAERGVVNFRDSVATAIKVISAAGSKTPINLPLNLGVDEQGQPVIEDLTRMPHLLIAGHTDSGKSTLLHSILGTIVYTMNSRDVQLVLADMKAGIEFTTYEGAPHLAFPVSKTPFQTLERMQWIIDIMEDRLHVIANAGKRDIFGYNAVAKMIGGNHLPYIILVLDEAASLFGKNNKGGATSGKSSKIADDMLSTICAKARAAGVYIILATQRPSVDVIGGSIKVNIPARLSFRLPTGVDSRTVLGTEGAEDLLSRGDCLFVSPMRPAAMRLHSPFASVEDVRAAVEYAKAREAGTAL